MKHLLLSAMAAQVAGVSLPEAVKLDGLHDPLVLIGVVIREVFFVDIHVAARCLAGRQFDVGGLLSEPPANREAMVFVYSEVTESKSAGAWREGFEMNLSVSRLPVPENRIAQFVALFRDMRAADIVSLDCVPGQAAGISINGRPGGSLTELTLIRHYLRSGWAKNQ